MPSGTVPRRQELVQASPRAGSGVRPWHGAYVLLSGGTSALLLLYVVVPARGLDPAEYSRFASLFGIVVLLGVVFTGVQTYVAGSLAGVGTEGRTWATRAIRARVARWCATLVGVLALSAPLMASALRTSLASVALVGVLSTLTLVCQASLARAEFPSSSTNWRRRRQRTRVCGTVVTGLLRGDRGLSEN